MFNAIADHIPELTPVSPPERLRSSFINGIKHWQVDLTPRRRDGWKQLTNCPPSSDFVVDA